MDRVLHKLKPAAYDPPTVEAADPNVWLGPTSGPEFDAWCARAVVATGAPAVDMMSAAAMFVCEEGDLATAAAFEDFPPPDILAALGPVTICTACFPEKAQ